MVETQELKHIVRVANVDLPGSKPLRIALTQIKGIGINLADVICKISSVKKDMRAGALTSSDVEKLNKVINDLSGNGVPHWMFNHRKDFESDSDKHLILGNLNFVNDNDLKRLKKLKTYIGVRHIKGLPVRGQRTRSNFRTSKGKVVGVSKKKQAPAKAGDDSGKKAKK